jgi:putative membrane protein
MRGIGTAVASLLMVAAVQSGAAQDTVRPPTDAEIAGIVVAANRIDADMGEYAAGRARHAAVREFAATMTRDHRAVLAQVTALAERLGVTPARNAVTRDLEDGARKARAQLEGTAAGDFDAAYVDHEIAFHEAVINAVDALLIPNARHPELKKAIEEVRPALVAHLEHARHLRGALQ